MTYATFLLAFLLPPILWLGWRLLAGGHDSRRSLLWIAALALIALLYTTPWDNYLVANRLWWYEPARVSGLTIGWVPLEEYLFFVLQPLATGLWTVMVLRRRPPTVMRISTRRGRRLAGAGLLAGAWGTALILLLAAVAPWRYLALILIWALPPLTLQWLYGGDRLWAEWPGALLAVLPPTVYLAAADGLAIALGIWTIHPDYSLGLNLLGILPLEEFLFFLFTNCLIAFGVLLAAARWPRAVRPQAA